MKRTAALVVIATAFVVVPVLGAAPPGPGDDVNGPRCANILEGQASYDTDAGTAKPTVTGLISLEVPACKGLDRYVLHVLDLAGTTELAITTGQAGPSPTEIGFRYAFDSGAPSAVCVYITSHTPGGRMIDRAPDTGCVDLGLDGGAGGRTFQG